MPSPAQLRTKRINKLFAEFKGKNTAAIDAIFIKALDLFPDVSEAIAKDYARAVVRMIKAKK